MNPPVVYAQIFIATVILSWVAGYVIIRRWPGGNHLSMSGHGASHSHAYAIFASTLSFTAVTTYLFVDEWLIPTFDLHGSLKIVALLFAVLQVITAWVPDKPGLKRRVHRFSAYSLAALMPVELGYLIFGPQVSTFAQIVCSGVVFGMLVIIYRRLFNKNWEQNFLIYQSVYIIGCQIAIIAAILIRK